MMNDLNILRHSRVDYSASVEKDAAGNRRRSLSITDVVISLAAVLMLAVSLGAAYA